MPKGGYTKNGKTVNRSSGSRNVASNTKSKRNYGKAKANRRSSYA